MGNFGVRVNGVPRFSAPIQGSTGSTAAPGFSFVGNPTTGLEAVGSGIGLVSAGANLMLVTNGEARIASGGVFS